MTDEGASTSPFEQKHDPRLGGGPVLDGDVFASLQALAGDDDPDLVPELVQLYLEDSAERIDEVRAGHAAFEPDRVGSAAHALKSASANIGAVAFSRTCAELEQAARSVGGADPDELQRLCEHALAMYAEVRAALDSLP